MISGICSKFKLHCKSCNRDTRHSSISHCLLFSVSIQLKKSFTCKCQATIWQMPGTAVTNTSTSLNSVTMQANEQSTTSSILGHVQNQIMVGWWLGCHQVSVLDSVTEGPGFKSQSRRCRVTDLGKLFTPIVPLFTKQQNW